MRTESNEIKMIKIQNLIHHPDNPRKDLGDLSELVESIKKNGIMQNLTVIPISCIEKDEGEQPDASNISVLSNFYVLIGNRRMEACLQAGVEKVPCKIVSNISKKEQIGIMLEENMQRNDLTVYEQAQGFQMMLDLGETAESIAEKTGFSKSTVYHRLNIAKLDQKVLKEKETCYQLSIKDLAALEQIEDVKTRNRVLKEATDSNQLVYKASYEAQQEKKNKNKAKLIKLLKAEEISECKDFNNHQYDGIYEEVKRYNLEKEYKTLKLPKDKTVMMYADRWGREIVVVKKAVKKKKELSEHEIKQKEADKRKKQIKDIYRVFIKDVKNFIYETIGGKYTADKSEDILKLVWDAFMKTSGYSSVGFSAARGIFTDKYWYDIEQSEKDEIKNKVDSLTYEQQALACLYNAMDNSGEIVRYDGTYHEENAAILISGVEILSKYGFTYSNDEQMEVITGSSELYKEKEV